jgi:hypothetical protein
MEQGLVVPVAATPAADFGALNTAHRSIAIGAKNSTSESVRVNMGAGHSNQNRIIQFDIVNSQAGAVNEVVRIGSPLGLADSYPRYNTTKSASDSVNGISDNFGVNVQKCQGFSEMSSHSPVFVKEIKIISSDTTQLNTQFSHKTILVDFTIIPLVQNIAFTRDKSDQAADLNVAIGSWLLSSKHFLEFTSIAGKNVQIIMEVASVSNVREFVEL